MNAPAIPNEIAAAASQATISQTLAEFAAALRAGVRRGGKILIPAFATERAQLLLHLLRGLMASGEVPRVPVFLDSPMAVRAGGAYAEYRSELRPELRSELERGDDPFAPSTLHTVRTGAESVRLNRYDGAAIILAGNGMLSGGRILHHLRHQLPKESTTLLLVSFQAPGGLGAQLAGGASQVSVLGEEVPVRATVQSIGGFSAHADQDDLLAWLSHTGQARVWLVHGEDGAMHDFAALLRQRGRQAGVVPDGGAVDLLADAQAIPVQRS